MQVPHQPTNQTTPPSLLARICDRDDELAWQTFCDVYTPLLYNYCRKRGLQASDTADVVQEALLRVTKGILTFEYDPRRGRFRDWLYKIVYHEICRLASRQKSSLEISQLLPELIADDNQVWNEHFHDHILKCALDRIEHRFEMETWQAFIGVWLNHRPADEVAIQLNRSLDFVYLSKSRVIKRLRLEVEQLADEAGLNYG